MIYKQPFSGSKKNLLFPFSIAIIPIGFLCLQLLPSRQIQNAAPRATTVLSPLPLAGTCHHDDLAPAQEKKQPRATKNSHHGPQLGPSPRRGQSCLCGANGAIPVATSVPTTQSRLLFYSHEKLSWMVKISHSKCWYEAL